VVVRTRGGHANVYGISEPIPLLHTIESAREVSALRVSVPTKGKNSNPDSEAVSVVTQGCGSCRISNCACGHAWAGSCCVKRRRKLFLHSSPLADPTPKNARMLRLISPIRMMTCCVNVGNKKVTAQDYMRTNECMRKRSKREENALFKGRIGE